SPLRPPRQRLAVAGRADWCVRGCFFLPLAPHSRYADQLKIRCAHNLVPLPSASSLQSAAHRGDRSMPHVVNRRDFLRTSACGGSALGGLLSLGTDLRAAQAEVRSLKIANAREVPSVCPYCAVGCGQIVSVRDGQIVNIEGNPESPISRGTLCPKGAATYQL